MAGAAKRGRRGGRGRPRPCARAVRKTKRGRRLRNRGTGCGGSGDGTRGAAERVSVTRGPKPEGGAVPALWLPGAAARNRSLLPPTGREARWKRPQPHALPLVAEAAGVLLLALGFPETASRPTPCKPRPEIGPAHWAPPLAPGHASPGELATEASLGSSRALRWLPGPGQRHTRRENVGPCAGGTS